MIELECLENVEGAKAEHDLVLFALSTCGWCRKARDFLDGNDIAYRYVYVDRLEGDERDEVVGIVKGYNPRMGFPTLVMDEGDVLLGFDEPAYKEKLL